MHPAPLEQLVIRPHIVPLLPTFHGMESENPYSHIKEFEEVCNTFREGGASIDLMRLKLFPFTLKDKAKIWLNSLRPRSIRNWVDLQAEYMEAINACPHHGFDTWLLVSYFYDGMSSSMKQILETMCGGDFMSKNPEEAMDFLSYVAEVSRGWDEPNSREKGKFPSQQTQNPKAGMPNNSASYGNTYNSSWRNHPNFSWKPRPPPYQPQGQTQAPQQPSSVEQAIVNLSKVMGDFNGGMQNDLSQKIDNIQYSISRLTNLNTVIEKGKFPSQPSQNPKGVHEVETQDGESSNLRGQSCDHFESGRRLINPCLSGPDEELISKRPLIKEGNNQEEKSGKKCIQIKH
ncbi:hypothetical protein CK203_039567 [Vitis vinifera]|uniref:Retrotransposon gag domain-containing protein n=1 Tax=Vitis vinifera TaxID=29760 RepID=A0A438GT35_VITVI|nr:hypothetical protein CK203_062335 [Vitis vinifera]RVW84022.1 hypothetical protein CK203_047372 [Vitis vinifera]RVW84954.1 hypothetical protein CK203_039567 [Vitis vinifera]